MDPSNQSLAISANSQQQSPQLATVGTPAPSPAFFRPFSNVIPQKPLQHLQQAQGLISPAPANSVAPVGSLYGQGKVRERVLYVGNRRNGIFSSITVTFKNAKVDFLKDCFRLCVIQLAYIFHS